MQRTRRQSTVVLTVVALLAAGAAVLGVTPAQASSQAFNLYSQPNDTASSGPIPHGSNTITLVVSPSSANVGASIGVFILDGTYPLLNNTASSIPANSAELDAVITLGGVDYVLRGSRNTVVIPTGQNVFSSWLINSTAGGSSSIGFGNINGTTGVGTAIRGAETTPVALVAPSSAGTYTIGLKAIIVNRIATGGTAALTDLPDEITNTDATNSGGAPGTIGPGGPTGSFALNASNGATATNGNFVYATPVTLVAIGPTGAVATSTGQSAGVQAVRPPVSTWASPTVTVGMSGLNWTAGTGIGSFTFQFCNTSGLACDPTPVSTVGLFQNTLGTDGTGSLSGLLVISRNGCVGAGCSTPMLTTGSRTVRLTQGAKVALVPIQVLTDAAIFVSPSSGPQGTAVTVIGANFNPSQLLHLTGVTSTCPGTCALSSDGVNSATAASSIGSFSAIVYPVNDVDTMALVVYEGALAAASAANIIATSAFVPNQDFCTADTGNVNTGTCHTRQRVYNTILSGNLVQQATAGPGNPDDTTVVFCSVAAPISPPSGIPSGSTSPCGLTSQITAASMYANLNPVSVTDSRGGTFGWSLTATMPDLTDGSHTISHSNVTITPSCVASAVGDPGVSAPGAAAGAASQVFTGTVSLCVKNTAIAPAPGSQSSGGRWTISAPMTLTVPAFKAAGTYIATMTITLA